MRTLAVGLVLLGLCEARGASGGALTREPAPAARTGFERVAAVGLDAPLPPSLAMPPRGSDAPAFRIGEPDGQGPATADSVSRAAAADSASRAAAADSASRPATADSTARVAADSKERAGEPQLGAARAQVVLRSLTVPGWGQATLGHSTAAAVFGLIEAGVWTSYIAFRLQEEMRTSTFERTALLFAGIDVRPRDEEFRRIVGQYSSSDSYNQYVVRRDAANIYLSDPSHLDYDGYHAYIAAHELRGADTWSWPSFESAQAYRDQRKTAQRAALRANTALALALVNRLVSVLHVARLHGAADAHPRSWNIEVTPDPGTEPTAFRFGVRTRF